VVLTIFEDPDVPFGIRVMECVPEAVAGCTLGIVTPAKASISSAVMPMRFMKFLKRFKPHMSQNLRRSIPNYLIKN
jgi:hypothetical protein